MTRRNVHRAWAIIGPGPWVCHFCGKSITKRGRGNADCHAHHIDGNKSNDVVGNVVPAHGLCHHRYHHVNGDHPGMTGKKHSEETKRKLSEMRKGVPTGRAGISLSHETRKAIGDGVRGTKQTKEWRNKIAQSRKERGTNQPFLGRTHSPETKEKMRQAAIRREAAKKGLSHDASDQ